MHKNMSGIFIILVCTVTGVVPVATAAAWQTYAFHISCMQHLRKRTVSFGRAAGRCRSRPRYVAMSVHIVSQ